MSQTKFKTSLSFKADTISRLKAYAKSEERPASFFAERWVKEKLDQLGIAAPAVTEGDYAVASN